ncbi:hypothetical protein FB567DRAFT_329808 [Paraphoma chrysanthemicola]|uniref:Uncharacterized protein n=1 Tax=Paraphoma chrysanthemicola TaxID=798071 RepID=A0A8K0VZ57_9PLEO|nr:hypothetical protein FB567DRAFT_329808 [Paraphoma chrysanthemicola]
MSQFDDHGAATGPYGPGNAPPPPMDPPPSKVGRKRFRDERVEASSASTAPHESYSKQISDTPRRKVSSNQRRKLRLNQEREKLRKERAALEHTKNNWRSRSPSRDEFQGANERHRAYWSDSRDDDQDGAQKGRWNPQYEDRQHLQDARQFTPNQVVDETPGRLSPGKADPNHYHNSYDDTKDVRDVRDGRDQWGNDNEYSWSPRRSQPPAQYDHGNGEGEYQPKHG